MWLLGDDGKRGGCREVCEIIEVACRTSSVSICIEAIELLELEQGLVEIGEGRESRSKVPVRRVETGEAGKGSRVSLSESPVRRVETGGSAGGKFKE